MVFVIISFIGMYFGRKVGWWLSRKILYLGPVPLAVICCVGWGMFVALAIRYLIDIYEPFWLLRWIFGYALGWYVSIPNYGLLMESTIPDEARPRHFLIFTLPSTLYLICTAALAIANWYHYPT